MTDQELATRVDTMGDPRDSPTAACDWCGSYAHRVVMDGSPSPACVTEARDYLARLLTHYAPRCEPLPGIQGVITQICPEDCRVSPWVKPFAAFKPNVNPAYAWEPVIWRGGRMKRERTEPTVRDWFSGNITLRRGLTGAKSEEFVAWLLQLLGIQGDDEIVDVYPGTGVVGRTVDRWRRYKGSLPVIESLLSDEAMR